jgi:bla regulator protein blaR1
MTARTMHYAVFLRRPILAGTLSTFLLLVIVPAIAQTSPSPTQVTAWQTAAGGHAEFEVASIHLSEPGTFLRPNMVLNAEDTPVPAGGHFVADFSLLIFIEFAWNLMPTREQESAMVAHLPRWVATDHFVIRAQFSGNPTKDQIRLMMQSLLVERFGLAVHFETHEAPAFALVASSPGKLGPRIRPHSNGPACDAMVAVPADRASPTLPPGGFLAACGRVLTVDGPNHTVVLGARNITLDHLAGYLGDIGNLDRPLVNQTGFAGTYDFSMSWLPEREGSSAAPAAQSLDAQGPSFIEALRDDLGLKLKPTRAPIQTLVVDHVEQPTPN